MSIYALYLYVAWQRQRAAFLLSVMAAHAVTVAWCSPFQCSAWLFVCCLILVRFGFCWPDYYYVWHNLLKIGISSERSVTEEFLHLHKIPAVIVRTLSSPWITFPVSRRRQLLRERKQKWGCRVGVLVRLGKQPHKPTLPSLFLTNAKSLVNKMDELRLQLYCSLQKPDFILSYQTLLFS